MSALFAPSKAAIGALLRLTVILTVVIAPSVANTQPRPGADAPFAINGKVALSSLIALSDGRLQKLADSYRLLALTAAVRSADWTRIRGPLAAAAKHNAAALNWFALPDGSYWSVQHGKEKENLSTRGYFPHLLAGRTVMGELVASKATGKPVAIVAVPVVSADGRTVGVLGASVYLDRLSAWLTREMGLGEGVIFYSFDGHPRIALNWDPQLIFYQPMRVPEVAKAFTQMLHADRGVARYRLRGKPRVVIYRRSPVTQWWYALGLTAEANGQGP